MQGASDSKIILSLLHPTKGHPIQQWRFERVDVIRIGRADDNEVTVADQQVSRRHAELRFDGKTWELFNLGRNGTIFEGKGVERGILPSGAVFQLGSGGPTFEFREKPAIAIDEQTTVFRQIDLGASLAIDEGVRDQELEQIVETPFFQKLQQNVAKIRGKRTVGGEASEAKE